MRTFRLIIFLIIVLLFAPPARSIPENQADKIMIEVIKRALENDVQKIKKVTYTKTQVIENLSSSGVKKRIYYCYGINGLMVEDMTYNNGDKIPQKADPSFPFDFNAVFASKYIFEMVNSNPIIIGQKPYYVISFRPKKGLRINKDLKIKDEIIEEIVNRLWGTLYIDVDQMYVYMANAEIKRFRKYWVGTISQFDLHFEQQEFEGIIVPKVIIATGKGDIKIWELNQRHTFLYGNFRLKN